jgi:hypothetical protein
MAPCTFDVKFSLNTQFTFRSLMFAAGEDEDLRILPPRPALERLTPTDGQASWSLMTSPTSGGVCSSLDPFTRLYICIAKIVQGISVMMSTLRPLAGASSSSSSAVSPDQDLSNDYPEIGISACGDSAKEGHLIFLVAPNGHPSHNSSNRYLTIERSKASNIRTPNADMIQNLNPNFNIVRLETIMETIQRLAPESSPLVALAQQGAEVANLIATEKSIGNPCREPSVDNRSHDQAR